MIELSNEFNLGKDKNRIKDPRDGARQAETAARILERFFDRATGRKCEIQILADEVGMGKTYVSLAVAYSILAAMRAGKSSSDLDGCYQKILIVTPANQQLFGKWVKEVGEFVGRCGLGPFADSAKGWFASESADRFDKLVSALRRPGGAGPRIVVTSLQVFAGGKLRDYDLKRRFLLGCLFRFWGNKLNYEERERLLKGSPWDLNHNELSTLDADDLERTFFSEDEVVRAIAGIERRAEPEAYWFLEKLFQECKSIGAPYVHERDERFVSIDKLLPELYREVAAELIGQDLPLVIVDEAHNWKNGPASGANGYQKFARWIAPHCRRALLLTATPFQLRPDEMLEILKVSDNLKPSSTIAESDQRTERLRKLRDDTIRPVLDHAAGSSARFAKAWARLPKELSRGEITATWDSDALIKIRKKLRGLALEDNSLDIQVVERVARESTAHLDAKTREFFREALQLYAFNQDLSAELGRLVIRHRRGTNHRAVLVGREFEQAQIGAMLPERQDRHLLHGAPGLDVTGEAELPHYLLMRCVSEMKGGHGKSSLGNTLTGCYSTLLHSREGVQVQDKLGESLAGRVYLTLLKDMVRPSHDARHPKVRRVVESVVKAWSRGEKSLIFCFRVNTAEQLAKIIRKRIQGVLELRRKACLGGEEALKVLRGRLTGRNRDLIGLGLDRVLWSLLCGAPTDERVPWTSADLELRESDLRCIAATALKFGVDPLEEHPDRVFLNRATEQAIAARLLLEVSAENPWVPVLKRMATPSWVSHAYGLVDGVSSGEERDAAGEIEDAGAHDERGVHEVFAARDEPVSEKEIDDLTAKLIQRRLQNAKTDQVAILDSYRLSPSLWFGRSPSEARPESRVGRTISAIHGHLLNLTRTTRGFDWAGRLLVLQALRRAVLRDSILLRLLPDRSELAEAHWGDLLADKFFENIEGQGESQADRVAVFLEDLQAASGDIQDEESARYAFHNATRLRGQQFVALVTGKTAQETRTRVFDGFNTPLLPEVLICTSVGQEGIDLHRHCRHVIHYDLAWNPAVLEQRTGRADRIGSKAFRERALRGNSTFLEVGIPFLAGTYDERMYEELRLRAQTFEMLTGGDVSADNLEGADDQPDAEGRPQWLSLVALPEHMVMDLRVNLHVWRDPDVGHAEQARAGDG